jgi:hypothetical protein
MSQIIVASSDGYMPSISAFDPTSGAFLGDYDLINPPNALPSPLALAAFSGPRITASGPQIFTTLFALNVTSQIIIAWTMTPTPKDAVAQQVINGGVGVQANSLAVYQTTGNVGWLYVLASDGQQGGGILRYDLLNYQPAGLTGTAGDPTFIPAGTFSAGPYQGLACSLSGTLAVANGSSISYFDAETGAPAGVISVSQYGFDSPSTLAFGPDGNLYVLAGTSVLRFLGTTSKPFGATSNPGGGTTSPVLAPTGSVAEDTSAMTVGGSPASPVVWMAWDDSSDGGPGPTIQPFDGNTGAPLAPLPGGFAFDAPTAILLIPPYEAPRAKEGKDSKDTKEVKESKESKEAIKEQHPEKHPVDKTQWHKGEIDTASANRGDSSRWLQSIATSQSSRGMQFAKGIGQRGQEEKQLRAFIRPEERPVLGERALDESSRGAGLDGCRAVSVEDARS